MENKEYLERLGERIVDFRTEKELTQEELADRIGVSRMQLYRIENGKINTSIGMLLSICEKLGINMKDLFDFEY